MSDQKLPPLPEGVKFIKKGFLYKEHFWEIGANITVFSVWPKKRKIKFCKRCANHYWRQYQRWGLLGLVDRIYACEWAIKAEELEDQP